MYKTLSRIRKSALAIDLCALPLLVLCPTLHAEATPEPATFVFICCGLLLIAIGIFRRRR